MNVVIRCCPKRVWYVEQYIVSELHRQGVTSIKVWNDERHAGVLGSFLDVCEWMAKQDAEGFWILQDDVLLHSQFAEIAELCPKNTVVNGFVYRDDGLRSDNYKYIGLQPIENYWFSFPCCYIPIRHIKGFLNWFYDSAISGKYHRAISKNLYDDLLFWNYLKSLQSAELIYNMTPNLCEHVDYLIGGSMTESPKKEIRNAYYWNEPERTEKLKQRLEASRI